MAANEIEIFTEILASDRLGAFQNWSQGIVAALGEDPSVLWEQIKWNPWAAMAIFEDLEDKDATLYSCLEKRRDGVLSLPRRVLPASDSPQDQKIAAFIDETLEQYWAGSSSLFEQETDETPFESFLTEALDAVGDGVTIGEIIFAAAKDRIFIKEVKFKPQHLFAFGGTGLASYSTAMMAYPQTGRLHVRNGILIEGVGMDGELPEHKFFVFSYRPKKGNRWGSPLKRKVFWQCWIKKAAARGWLRYIDKGSGTVVARYNDGASASEQSLAVSAAAAVQEESAVAIPKKFLLEVHEMVRNIGSSHSELVDGYCNAEIARAIVGQTLTGRGSDGGGSRSMGEVHERVEQKKIETDAKALMAVVNKRLVRPLTLLNFGPNAKTPQWTLEYEQGENLKALSERHSKLHSIGLPLSKKYLYEAYQMPEPESDEDTLGGESEATETENAGDDDPRNSDKPADFAEKKTLKTGELDFKSSSKTRRFERLRPSMIEFLD